MINTGSAGVPDGPEPAGRPAASVFVLLPARASLVHSQDRPPRPTSRADSHGGHLLAGEAKCRADSARAAAESFYWSFSTPQFAWAWGARMHRMLLQIALDRAAGAMPPRGCVMARRARRSPSWRTSPTAGAAGTRIRSSTSTTRTTISTLRTWDQFGLTLDTLPHLRREYLRVLIIAKHEHPEGIDDYDAGKDPARAPRMARFRAARRCGAVCPATGRVQPGPDSRAGQRPRHAATSSPPARSIAVYHLGCLSHYVADIAQPLHTTKHFNGWVGSNPSGVPVAREIPQLSRPKGLVDRHHIDARRSATPYPDGAAGECR